MRSGKPFDRFLYLRVVNIMTEMGSNGGCGIDAERISYLSDRLAVIAFFISLGAVCFAIPAGAGLFPRRETEETQTGFTWAAQLQSSSQSEAALDAHIAFLNPDGGTGPPEGAGPPTNDGGPSQSCEVSRSSQSREHVSKSANRTESGGSSKSGGSGRSGSRRKRRRLYGQQLKKVGGCMNNSSCLLIHDFVLARDLINSLVENTPTNDCLLRCESLDQIGRSSFSARATKSTSSLSGIDEACCKNSEYSPSGINSTNTARSLLNFLNSSEEIPVFFNISPRCSLISCSANSGAKNSKSWSTKRPLVREPFQKNVNKTLVSTTNFIHIRPFFRNSSNLLRLDALCNLTDQSTISRSSSNCFTSLLTRKDRSISDSSISFSRSSGILITISAILAASDNNIGDGCLNNFSRQGWCG